MSLSAEAPPDLGLFIPLFVFSLPEEPSESSLLRFSFFEEPDPREASAEQAAGMIADELDTAD
jgi:hypothetical protein